MYSFFDLQILPTGILFIHTAKARRFQMPAVQRAQVVNPYQSLAQRIQRVITSPAAQSARSAFLYRSPEESENLWDMLIDELGENDSVRTERLDDGGVRVTWDPPSAD